MGKWSDAYPSRYMSKGDLDGGPVQLTISNILVETVSDGNADEDKHVMHFQNDKAKPLILNVTNGTTCFEAWGNNENDWAGHVVELYVDPGVTWAGKRVGGIRLRIPGEATLPNPSVKNLSWEQAQELCAGAGITLEVLKATLQDAGHSDYKPSRDSDTVRGLIAEQQQAESAGLGEDSSIPF